MIERLGMLLFLGGTALATSYATRTVAAQTSESTLRPMKTVVFAIATSRSTQVR